MKPISYILIGLITYSAILITNIPAAPVLYWLNDQQTAVKFQDVSGSLWYGSASQVTINARENLQQLTWEYRPLSILLASIGIDFHFSFSNEFRGTIYLHPTGTVTLKSLTGTLSAQKVHSLANIPFGELDGAIRIEIEEAVIRTSEVPEISGRMYWDNAKLTIAEEVSLGNIKIRLNSNTTPISGNLSNRDGDMNIYGTLDVSETGDYELQLNMKPLNSASRGLKNSLASFAIKQPNGEFRFTMKDNLKKSGLI